MEKLCIDERMVLFQEKSVLKQYNLQKPKKWGYKLYIVSGVDRLIHNFEVHSGAILICHNQPDSKAPGNIVPILLQNIPRMKWYKPCLDNWYTLIELVIRYFVCRNYQFKPFTKQQINIRCSHEKKGRGSMAIWTTSDDDVELCVVKWHGNPAVRLLFTYETVNPTTELLCWDRKEKKKAEAGFLCPFIEKTGQMPLKSRLSIFSGK